MLFVKRYDYRAKQEQYTVTEIVDQWVSEHDRIGAVEQLERQVWKITELLSIIIETLPAETQKNIASLMDYDVAKN